MGQSQLPAGGPAGLPRGDRFVIQVCTQDNPEGVSWMGLREDGSLGASELQDPMEFGGCLARAPPLSQQSS